MKRILFITLLFLFGCSPTEPEDVSYYDLYCSEGYVELWVNYYDIETTTDLNIDDIQGMIPPHIECLENLTSLDLSDNQLTGEIPSSIGNLTNLTELRLHDNNLTGQIPPSLGSLTNLGGLYLYNNQLTGEIPPEVCDLIESNDLWNFEYEIFQGNYNLINTCE